MPEPDVLNCRLFVPYFSLNWLQHSTEKLHATSQSPLLAQRNLPGLMNAG